jgi:hypothetical protein
LLAEKCHLGFARRLQSEQSNGEPAEQLQEVEHPAEGSPSLHLRHPGRDFW